jgi:prolyl oligopeptidase
LTSAYPATRREPATVAFAGLELPDPYAWLGDSASAEVQAWQAAQNALTDAYLAAWPHRDALERAVARYAVSQWPALPAFAGGRWFRVGTSPASARPALEVAERPAGPWTAAWDPGAGDALLGVDWFAPSPDGRLVACGVSRAGNEMRARLHVVDVETGAERPEGIDRVLNVWAGAPQWLADGSGFFYTAVAESAGALLHEVYLHRLGEPPAAEPEPLSAEDDYDGYLMVQTDTAGRWAVGSMGLMTPRPLNVRDLGQGSRWRSFARGLAGGSVTGAIVGDRYVAVTDHEAPRGRVVAIPLEGSGDVSTWEELVPESDVVLRTLRPVGGRLYVSALVDTYSRVLVFEPDGRPLRELALPDRGAVVAYSPGLVEQGRAGHPDEHLFWFSTFTTSWALYREDPASGEVVELEPPEVRLEGAVVEDRWATSADGARIPYQVLRPGAAAAGPRPALLHAYGGFNYAVPPAFPSAAAALVEAGGVFVLAHLRGGGELGREWWEQGRATNKQRGYDDLYAVAEHLIAGGVTTPRLLAVQGASNGGHMAAVALAQRPDLWAVAVPLVPYADPLRRSEYLDNRFELGDPDDPEDARRLASIAPYHLVRDGERYPATFIEAAESDELCPPGDARKLAARLQAATGGSEPILLRVLPNMGHGAVDTGEERVGRHADWLAFVFERLGLVPAGGRR